jgi:hypothetical protein
MLTDPNPAVTMRPRLLAQPKQSAEPLEHLRLIARQHQVCYEIWPVWSTREGVRRQKGFELLLCGVNGHVIRQRGGLHSVPCCQYCAHTYSELHELAEWVLDLEKTPARHRIHSFDCALHMAPPHRNHRSEIVTTASIFHPHGHNIEDYPSESECLKEVRKRLSTLGINEDVLYPAVSANAVE